MTLLLVIDAIITLPEELEPVYRDALGDILGEKEMAYISSFERLGRKLGREEGRQEGLQEGRQEGLEHGLERGREEGFAKVLAALITRKFGALPDWAKAYIADADEATLNHWALRILDAGRIEDVFI
jgi:flagellar biosynthesis/type III secretory pathway protein FliH